MYLLSCPNCHAELNVTPAQAGDATLCPKCQSQVAIPKLGELRKLPQSAATVSAPPAAVPSGGNTILFLVLGLAAVLALLGCGYNAMRWAMIETKTTTESHLQELQDSYAIAEPAKIVLEFEDMEELSLDLVTPYRYHLAVLEKERWGRNALIAASITLLCGGGAFFSVSRRDCKPQADT